MAGPSQRRPQDSSHPTGADDADVQPGRAAGRVVPGVIAPAAREAVSICEMHGRNLSGPPSPAPGRPLPTRVDGCPPERPSALTASSTAGSAPTVRSSTCSSTAVHTSSTGASTRPERVGANPLRHKGISRPGPALKHAGKTLGEPLARLRETRIEISHAARNGARKSEATSTDANRERRRTARRPTGHGGRGNPVAVADDDAATRTERADAIAVRRTAAGLPEGIRSRTSCRAQHEGVKAFSAAHVIVRGPPNSYFGGPFLMCSSRSHPHRADTPPH